MYFRRKMYRRNEQYFDYVCSFDFMEHQQTYDYIVPNTAVIQPNSTSYFLFRTNTKLYKVIYDYARQSGGKMLLT